MQHPLARRWHVTVVRPGQPGQPLMACDCETLPQATALAVVISRYWPGLTVRCRTAATGTAHPAAGGPGTAARAA